MKIVNLVKSEFIKNGSLKKYFFISLIVLIVTILFVELYDLNVKIKCFSYIPSYYTRTDLENKNNLTKEEEFELKIKKEYENGTEYFKSLKVSHSDYRARLFEELIQKKRENLAIEIYKDNKNSEDIKYICLSNKQYYESAFEGTISYICDRKDQIDKMYEENEKIIKDYNNLLKENKYYKYIEYQLKNDLIDKSSIPLAYIVINNKIVSPYDYLSLNYVQYDHLSDKLYLMDKKDFKKGEMEFSSYEQYTKFEHKLVKDATEMKSIIKYSSEKQVQHDLFFNRYDGVYDEYANAVNTKKSVNFIFHYSVLVMLIVTVTSSGIVSKEHKEGTIKKIVTTPIKRWKILLSKFIYLILHTYIIWFICLVILSLYSGFKYGFSDLLSPKLIYINNSVVEVNYFLYLTKDLFIASIPTICFLSILLFLSTVTLNTSITNVICTLLSIFSIIFWYIVDIFKLLIVTPLMYFDTGFIYTRSDTYMEVLTKFDISYSYGIVISILVTLILFIITNIIYNKRDI